MPLLIVVTQAENARGVARQPDKAVGLGVRPREHLDAARGLQHPLEAAVDAPFRVAANLRYRLWKGTAPIPTSAVSAATRPSC